MPGIPLTGENFLKQISKYGYLADKIPSCFNSERFSNNINELATLISTTKKQAESSRKNSTSPLTISSYKNDISRRVLSLPNPRAFLMSAKLISENWEEIKNASDSENSLSPITYLHCYDHGNIEMLNSENIREKMHSKSGFLDGIHNCIRLSLGYKYRLTIDIANCYDSIYTHSVSWAMCGKVDAKKYMLTKTPTTLKNKYELADRLDAFTRFQKNNETNGIVVGPYTSRIFSEIVLADIDRELRKNNFVFRRYIDDYKFYFRTESQVQESLSIIEKVLNGYNLNINTSKAIIKKYPYEIISPMRGEYDAVLKESGVFGVLNAANNFYESGEKGAFKYALKYIRKKPIPTESFDIILPTLINIMLLDPKYSEYVVKYLKLNQNGLDLHCFSKTINTELQSSLKNGFQQETLLFMHIIKELKLNIEAQKLITVIKSSEDLSIIIALDIWKNRRSSVIRTKKEAREINRSITELLNSLNGETYSGGRWLLLYEIEKKNLLNNHTFTFPAKDDFFKKLFDLDISFYSGLK